LGSLDEVGSEAEASNGSMCGGRMAGGCAGRHTVRSTVFMLADVAENLLQRSSDDPGAWLAQQMGVAVRDGAAQRLEDL
jgi:hypothetical protein